MSTGSGEAADQMVRMMLSGAEVTVRLGGSAMKNLLALTLALARQNKAVSGKVNLGKMLRETRDLRQFPMTPEQYAQFHRLAKKQKILYSAIHDKDGPGKRIDVILPVTELDRANALFPKVGLVQQESEQQEEHPSKKGSRSERASPGTRARSSTSRDARTMSERPSVGGRLQSYRAQLQAEQSRAPAKNKNRPRER